MDKAATLSLLKRIAIITTWVLLTGGLIAALLFANHRYQHLRCQSVSVTIDPENELRFINRDMAIRYLQSDGNEKAIQGKVVGMLHLPSVERRLLSNKYVRSAQVFTDMTGNIKVGIQQNIPVLRVINAKGESWYITQNGLKMPASPVFTAHVPVATGNIYESIEDTTELHSFVGQELLKIATYVDKDAFWKAQIEQIFVNAENELVLIPKVGDHTIQFGNTSDMEQKFSKLLLFYREALSRIGWDKYNNIDLRFKNQIVCKKKL